MHLMFLECFVIVVFWEVVSLRFWGGYSQKWLWLELKRSLSSVGMQCCSGMTAIIIGDAGWRF